MRHEVRSIVGAFVVAAALCANAGVVTDGLTNRWKIDQGSGTTAFDSVGSADGTFVNSPTWTTDTPGPNHPPYALDFEATEADYVTLGTDSVPTGSAGTIDLWFKIESWPATTYTTLFAKGPSAHWHNFYLGVFRNSSSESVLFHLADGTNYTQTNLSTGTLALNKWYHMAGTWDGTTAYLYLNGNQVDSYNTTITPPNTPGYKVDIGYGSYSTRHFDGIIDEIRIYDRALTPDEVLQNYVTVVPEPASLLLMGGALCGLVLRRRR